MQNYCWILTSLILPPTQFTLGHPISVCTTVKPLLTQNKESLAWVHMGRLWLRTAATDLLGLLKKETIYWCVTSFPITLPVPVLPTQYLAHEPSFKCWLLLFFFSWQYGIPSCLDPERWVMVFLIQRHWGFREICLFLQNRGKQKKESKNLLPIEERYGV